MIGAGSRSFGPGTVRDVLLSSTLQERGAQLVLMDINEKHVRHSEAYASAVAGHLGARSIAISATTDLAEALDGADFAIAAIEVNRFLYWTQDFHIPREYGFRQPFGENGGPGGIFHALRNIPPTVHIAREMEKRCPDAWLLNYTNPEHWLMEAVSRLTKVKCTGLCHGVWMGMEQIDRGEGAGHFQGHAPGGGPAHSGCRVPDSSSRMRPCCSTTYRRSALVPSCHT